MFLTVTSIKIPLGIYGTMLYCKLLVTLEGVAQEKKTIDNTAQEARRSFRLNSKYNIYFSLNLK